MGKVPLLVGWMYGGKAGRQRRAAASEGGFMAGAATLLPAAFFYFLFFFLPSPPPNRIVLEMLDAVLFVKQLTCQVSLITD